MQKCTVVQKIRNRNNQIIGYVLFDNLRTYTMTSLELYNAIRTNALQVDNIKISKNHKLIDIHRACKSNVCYIESSVILDCVLHSDEELYKFNCCFKSNIPNLNNHLAKLKLLNIPLKKYKRIAPHLLFIITDKTFEFLSDKQIKFRNSNVRQNMGLKPEGHFANMSFKSLDLSQVDTSEMTDMHSMFYNCHVQYLDLTNFNTSNVISMENMFASGLSYNTQLDVSMFDTSKVKYMTFMFERCYIQNPLDLSNFNTKNVINMYGMFINCEAPLINIQNFNYSSIENNGDMFTACRAKTIIGKPKKVIMP